MKWHSWLLVIAVLAILVVGTCSCAFDDAQSQASALREETTAMRENIAEAVAQLESLKLELLGVPEGPERDAAMAVQAKLAEYLAKARPMLEKAEAQLIRLENAKDWPDMIEAAGEGAKETGKDVGGGLGAIISLSGVLAVALARAWQNKTAAKKMASSLNGKLQLTDAQKADVRKEQGPYVNGIVDSVQGKKFSLPL